MKRILAVLFYVAFCGIFLMPQALKSQELWRVVDARQYGRMSQFERVQYEKGLNLLRDRQYRAAANEFDRFRIQYSESEALPYIVFLRGYALHQAKDRNQAIGVYNEVIDFWPGEINAAAPAMYYRGMAHFDNGDYIKGMNTMKELLSHPEYKTHPVAASASLCLVDNYWKNKEPEKAAGYLKQIFTDFPKSEAAKNSMRLLAAYYLSTDNMKAYDSWYRVNAAPEALEKGKSVAEVRVDMANMVYNLYIYEQHRYFNDDMIRKYRAGKKGSDPARVLWAYMQQLRPSYEKSQNMWSYYMNALKLHAGRRLVTSATFDGMVRDALELAKKTPDDEKNPGRQQKRIISLVDLLFQTSRWDHAAYVNSNVKDEEVRMWNEYRVLEGKSMWQEALDKLEAFKGKFASKSGLVSKANWKKAWILRDKMRKYEEAIKVYYEISQPPSTLYDIAECHKRNKKPQQAYQIYNEIEGSFSDTDGANAAWHRTVYAEQLGDKKRSIAEARRILKVYPKSRQSSWAHQHLEKLGVDATGGGGADADIF